MCIVTGQTGRGEFGAGAAKRGDDRCAHGGRDVHGAGVVGEHGVAFGEGGDELGERCFAGEVGGVFGRERFGDFGCGFHIAFAAEQEQLGLVFFDEDFGGFDEMRRGPALGGAVFGTGDEADFGVAGIF